jgi:hypothetical protein
MARQSVFVEEWRACLREQYKYVVRNNDATTIVSLTDVMYEVGFTDSELAELRVLATLRADETPDDFVPDIHALEPDDSRVFPAAAPEPSEVVEAVEDDSSETLVEIEMEADVVGIEDTSDDSDSGDEAANTGDPPQQLSLFG